MDDTHLPDKPTPPLGETEEPRLKAWHWALGASSLIPYAGLPSALVSLLFGLQRIRRGGAWLVVFAFLGVVSTGWYGGFLPWGTGQNTGERTTADVQRNLYRLIQDIEAYRASHGALPPNLDALRQATGAPILDVPCTVTREERPFYYAQLPDQRSYYLFSRGVDGEAFTTDDILPQLTNEERARWSYRVRPLDYNASSAAPRAEAAEAPEALSTLRWRDPEDGFAEARRTHRLVLLDFTAAWCGWCKRLEADVLSKPEVARYINGHFVPVRVMDRMNEEHKNQPVVADLQQRFAVRGFPTLVVTSGDYSRYDVQRGYVGDPGRFLQFLKRFAEP